ncbi:NUDIX domain-containing protein [Candidatus Micrarchaeota archaeon]|nr:NUDIX domain-containing protein [Candidatus Micrarchaeota archaeon]
MPEELVNKYHKTINLPFFGPYITGRKITRKEANTTKQPHVFVMLLLKDGEGRILLQQRAASKNDYPNFYTTSASGGLQATKGPFAVSEFIKGAAIREAIEELGIERQSIKKLKVLWKIPREIDSDNPHRLYLPLIAEYEGSFKINEKEVNPKGTTHYSTQEISELLKKEKFTPAARVILMHYLKTLNK